jgi:hypothetical protein
MQRSAACIAIRRSERKAQDMDQFTNTRQRQQEMRVTTQDKSDLFTAHLTGTTRVHFSDHRMFPSLV